MPPIPETLGAGLLAAQPMRSLEEVAAFEDALADVAALDDPDVIPQVLALHDRDTKFPEVLYPILHLGGAFPDVEYLLRLAVAARPLIARAAEWAETSHEGGLNAAGGQANGSSARGARGRPSWRSAGGSLAVDSVIGAVAQRKWRCARDSPSSVELVCWHRIAAST